ncbi:MBL fold metallo-hydrolase [Natronosalvus caseinilyticus]|uniref:MBL fold metallo-hydrolase n=1 Tax=Natronosalvus caseinilyticus TaxID=2953747 RepID=UPI0028ADB635|nr:MBL fold metallo-hydrolase [Natronosalvus caseinilyticus]
MEISDHVYVFPVETTYFGNERTFYLTGVETRRGLILFDVGGPDDEDVLEEALAQDGFTFDDVDKIVLTHQDYDHLGCLAPVATRTDAEILAHEYAAPYVSGEVKMLKRPKEPYPGVPVDIELTDGMRFHTQAGPVKALFTPGHAPGHLVFYVEERGLLIAGDLLYNEGGFSGPNRAMTPDLEEARNSIGRLIDLDVEMVLCHHGGPADVTEADILRVYHNFGTDI